MNWITISDERTEQIELLEQDPEAIQAARVDAIIIPAMSVADYPYGVPAEASYHAIGNITSYRARSVDECNVYVVSLGERSAQSTERYEESVRRAAGKAARQAMRDGHTQLRLAKRLENVEKVAKQSEVLAKNTEAADTQWLSAWLEGWLYGLYQFDKYRMNKAKQLQLSIDPTEWTGWSAETLAEALRTAEIRVQGTSLARDLVNEPANMLVPEELVSRVMIHFERSPVQVRVYRSEELEAMQMVGLLTIGAGSVHEPAMIELRYEADPTLPLLALIGKGVTFDMGGMNVKSGTDISDARMDMGGAAAVIGAMDILAASEAKVNVVALIPVVENVPDAKAVLPSAVIRYPNGMSVQIGNTDGEGRLILADALLHAANLGVKRAIDIATLTGNVGAALGLEIAGIWGDSTMTNQLVSAGEQCGERLWPMPLMDEYEIYLKSHYADINNTSSYSLAGAITAALFIRRFVAEGMQWCHIDMAGTSQYKSDVGYAEVGATGYGARLLADYTMHYSA